MIAYICDEDAVCYHSHIVHSHCVAAIGAVGMKVSGDIYLSQFYLIRILWGS